MTLSRDDGAQSNIDFLVGLAIFLMAFLYVFTFVPGLFVPYQASAVDLSAVAYKTGAMLVEDPGWYVYYSNDVPMGDPAWETQDLSRLARIGLAMDKTTPNVLSIDKIYALRDISSKSAIPQFDNVPGYDLIRDKMGLAGTLTYNYSLNLVMDNTFTGDKVELLDVTTQPKGSSIEYMERNVLIDMGRQLIIDCEGLTDIIQTLRVNLSAMPVDDHENVVFRIFNTNAPISIKSVKWVNNPYDANGPLLDSSQFLVRRNGEVVPFTQGMTMYFDPGDVVEIVVYNKAVRGTDISPEYPERHNFIKVESDAYVFPNELINYYVGENFKLRRVCNPGILKMEVWANEYI
jgi:hypothetical protein